MVSFHHVEIQQLHVTLAWCDDNVPHQVTKHRHEHIYENTLNGVIPSRGDSAITCYVSLVRR